MSQNLIPLTQAMAMGFNPQWSVSVEGDCLISQAGRGGVYRVVVTRNGKPLYDQWVIVEPIGAATAPIDEQGRLGLVQIWRPVVDTSQCQKLGEVVVSELGRLCWEVPRGFPHSAELSSATALREGAEEMGRRLTDPELLGYYRGNSTFFVNAVPLYVARARGDGEPMKGDPYERILAAQYFSPTEVGGMLDQGDLVDGFTLAALTYLGRRGLFRL